MMGEKEFLALRKVGRVWRIYSPYLISNLKKSFTNNTRHFESASSNVRQKVSCFKHAPGKDKL